MSFSILLLFQIEAWGNRELLSVHAALLLFSLALSFNAAAAAGELSRM